MFKESIKILLKKELLLSNIFWKCGIWVIFHSVSDTCHWIYCWNQRKCGPVWCHATGWGSVQSMASSCVWWVSPLAVSLKFISTKLYSYYKLDIASITNIIFSWFMSSHLSYLQWQCILICSNQRLPFQSDHGMKEFCCILTFGIQW